MSDEPLTDAERAELAKLEAELAKPYIPGEIAEQIYAEIPERIKAGAIALSHELAALARRDPEAFDRAWCAGIERLGAEAIEHALAQSARWAAPERHWRTSQ